MGLGEVFTEPKYVYLRFLTQVKNRLSIVGKEWNTL
jgi:hypothetical protein